MFRPRLSLASTAVIGAGLLAGAGVGAVAVSHIMGSSPTASIVTPAPAPQAPEPTPVPTAPAASSAKATRARLVLRSDLVKLVAQQTGTTVQQVRSEVEAGQTLDAIAGSDAQTVVSAALQEVTTKLDAEVAAGTITQAQETAQLSRAQTSITRLMAALPKAKAAPQATPAG